MKKELYFLVHEDELLLLAQMTREFQQEVEALLARKRLNFNSKDCAIRFDFRFLQLGPTAELFDNVEESRD